MTHHPDALYGQISWIALHFHWDLDAILDLEHADRRRFVDEITRLSGAERRTGARG